jgi:arginyl-tRNA synthetase
VRQNHLGDWGTQFGMLIQDVDEHPERDGMSLDDRYRVARERFDADVAFAGRARARVVALQSGDPATVAVWRALVAESERSFQAIYDRLGVLLTPADAAGESTYNRFLAEVVDELVGAGIAVESDGALCVFFPDLGGPLILRKSDGGYGYAATDLATVRYRIRDLGATRILYVVDARQALHFRMVMATARRAGWLTDDVHAEHVAFGTVLDAGGRPFKSRAGGTVRLADLLDAAVDRARAVIGDKGPEWEPVVRAVGIGAVKYAELSTSRTKDYAFDLDRMTALTGNTGVYMQYAYARIRSILARLPDDVPADVDRELPLEPAERALALALDEFDGVLAEAAATLEPHRLCGYLYALAKAFSDFYEQCPVVGAEPPARRANRVALCRLAGRTVATGLDLLGIEAPARM